MEENIFDASDDPFSDNVQTYTMGSSMNDDDDEFGE